MPDCSSLLPRVLSPNATRYDEADLRSSWRRAIGVDHHSGRGHLGMLKRQWLVMLAEQPLTAAQDQRVDQQDVLVDQLRDRPNELPAAQDDEVLLGLELGDVVERDD